MATEWPIPTFAGRPLSGQAAMEAVMREVFAKAGKSLKFWSVNGPRRWIIVVDGKRLSQNYDNEAAAFQQALDKSGIGGKISYEPTGDTQWEFKYFPQS